MSSAGFGKRSSATTAATCLSLLTAFGCQHEAESGHGVRVRLFRGTTLSDELGWRDHVSVGDVLSLEIEVPRPLYVYVWNRDSTGQEALLFPQPGAGTVTPLASGRVHRVPGASGGMDRYWTVDSGGGDEQLWVVAAESPIGAASFPERLRNTMLTVEATGRRAGHFVYEETALEHGETVWVGWIELRGEP